MSDICVPLCGVVVQSRVMIAQVRLGGNHPQQVPMSCFQTIICHIHNCSTRVFAETGTGGAINHHRATSVSVSLSDVRLDVQAVHQPIR